MGGEAKAKQKDEKAGSSKATSNKKNRIGLADLREEDKAKVARLINQVVAALREIQRLKELLEQERKCHDSLVRRLQQQNHDQIASTMSHTVARGPEAETQATEWKGDVEIRNSLRARENMSGLDGNCPKSEGSQGHDETQATEWKRDVETRNILRARGNMSGLDGNCPKSEGSQGHDENTKIGSQAADTEANLEYSSRKENRDPLRVDSSKAPNQNAGLPRRPQPRPLPQLLATILRSPKLGVPNPAKCEPNPAASNLVWEGQLQCRKLPTLPTSRDNVRSKSLNADESICFPTDRIHLECPKRGGQFEAAQNDREDVNGDGQCQASVLVLGHCTHSIGPQIFPLDENPDEVDEVAHGDTQNHVSLEKTCSQMYIKENYEGGQRKLSQFDASCGKGRELCASDVQKDISRKNGAASSKRTTLETLGNEDRCHVERETEEQRLKTCTVESHWAPEAIERRNSFHTIPVASPRFAKDNDAHVSAQKASAPGSSGHGSKENRTCSTPSTNEEESKHLPESESGDFCATLNPPKWRRSSTTLSKANKDLSCPTRRATCRARVSRCERFPAPCESNLQMHRSRKCRSLHAKTKSSNTEEETGASDALKLSRYGNKWRDTRHKIPLKREVSRSLLPCQTRRRQGEIRFEDQEERSQQGNVVYCITSEDLYVPSSNKSGKSSAPFPVNMSSLVVRKMKGQRASGQETSAAKLHFYRKSKPTRSTFHVKHEVLDVLLQSKDEETLETRTRNNTETERAWNSGRGRSFPGTRVKHRSGAGINVDRPLQVTNQCPSEVAQPNFTDWGTSMSPSWDSGSSQRYYHKQGKNQTSESSRMTFDVDDLLDKFIQSNAECAAELIKCYVYFESNTSRSPSRISLLSGHNTQDPIVSIDRPHRRELFRVNQDCPTSERACPEDLVNCAKYSSVLTYQPIHLQSWARFTDENEDKKDLRVRCSTCSIVRKSKKMNTHTHIAPPTVLPKVQKNVFFNNMKVRRRENMW